MVIKHIFCHRVVGMVSLSDRLELQSNIPEPLKFEFSGFKATSYLMEGFTIRDGIKLHTGIELVTHLECDELSDENKIIDSIIETILNLVSLTAVASCENAELSSHIKITSDENGWAEFFSYPIPKNNIIIGTPRKIDQAHLKIIWAAWDKSEHRDRLMRALSWFRKGLSENANVDKFICNWIAIEVLKSILRRMLLTRQPDEWAGVEKVFQIVDSTLDFKEVCETRNQLLHGYHELTPEFLSKIAKYIEPTRKALIICIIRVLGLDDSIAIDVAAISPRRMLSNFSVRISGKLTSLPSTVPEILSILPSMEIEAKISAYHLKENGEIEYELQTTYKPHLPEKTVFTPDHGTITENGEAGITGAIISKPFV